MSDEATEHAHGPWVDNHCHLELERGDDGAYAAMGRGPTEDSEHTTSLLAAARAAGVIAMITVGTDAGSSRSGLELASRHPDVFATAGLHPHDATDGTEGVRRVVDEAFERGAPPVAVGECGLDFHYDHSPRDVQREAFADQIRLAHELDLPLVIHTREAWKDTFDVLDAEGTPARTVFHCFTGGPADAEGCLERGALLSISGIVTFPSAQDIRDAVAVAPLARLMVETDSPYLAPVPLRGRPNTPALVGLIGAEVARVKGVEVAEVARVTTANARAFYRLDA